MPTVTSVCQREDKTLGSKLQPLADPGQYRQSSEQFHGHLEHLLPAPSSCILCRRGQSPLCPAATLLLLIQAKILLVFQAASAQCCLMSTFSSTRTHESFSARVVLTKFFSQSVCVSGIALTQGKQTSWTWSCWTSLGLCGSTSQIYPRPFGCQPFLLLNQPSLVPSANLLKVRSILLSRLLIKMLKGACL